MPCVLAMTKLAEVIRAEIAARGDMPLSRYMELCLAHPEYGYYMTRDPFGASGDFTTAPEISQMFGELIGAWIISAWQAMGEPSRFILLEAGPGRGTLMSDVLRVAQKTPGFMVAASLHLLETSPVLKQRQAVSLSAYNPIWHDDLTTVPDDAPVLFVGNEFLDALPVDPLRQVQGTWQQVCVGVPADQDASFCYTAHPASQNLIDLIPRRLMPHTEGSVIEVSEYLNQFLNSLFLQVEKQTGVALFIDYGYRHSDTGDSVQAVHKHQFVSIFHAPGESDITAHVNFENIQNLAFSAGLTTHGPLTQGAFLNRLGIDHRAARLKERATDAQKADIDSALRRLTAPDQMGDLFKVLAVSSDPSMMLPGF
jgi:NADH dehydrogenase [ubiquinone] 1 alpha subcomplex assembly factor 7